MPERFECSAADALATVLHPIRNELGLDLWTNGVTSVFLRTMRASGDRRHLLSFTLLPISLRECHNILISKNGEFSLVAGSRIPGVTS